MPVTDLGQNPCGFASRSNRVPGQSTTARKEAKSRGESASDPRDCAIASTPTAAAARAPAIDRQGLELNIRPSDSSKW